MTNALDYIRLVYSKAMLTQEFDEVVFLDDKLHIIWLYDKQVPGHSQRDFDALVGKAYLSILPQDHADQIRPHLLANIAGHVHEEVLVRSTAQGPRIAYLKRMPVYDKLNQVVGLSSFLKLLPEAVTLAAQQIDAAAPALTQLTGPASKPAADDTRYLAQEREALQGRLLAGIAHELNTPIGAVAAGMSNLALMLPALMAMLPQAARLLATEGNSLATTVLELMADEPVAISSAERRKAVLRTEATLSDADMPDAYEMAQQLVDLGLSTKLDLLIPYLGKSGTPELLKVLGMVGQMKNAIMNVSLGAEKARKLVKTLREYNSAQPRLEHRPQLVSESLQRVLAIFHNAIKYGISLQLDLQADCWVAADAETLDLVWMNTIENALEAMQHKGTLALTCAVVNEQVQVTITDSGPGIAEGIQPHIFDKGSTTKTTGDAMGWGLYLTQEAVQLLGGSISHSSVPGKTTFVVRLPRAS